MLNNGVLISVIIAAYNIEDYLGSCLDSIISQTNTKLEIIVVDDGSIDRTSELADYYQAKDPRIRVIHKKNEGVTSARLCGMREATGSWIGFVDGDDWIEPDMYERLLTNALDHNAEISHCGYQMVFSDRIDYYYNTGRIVCQGSREALKELLGGSYEPSLCNKLFKRSLILSMLTENQLDENIKINEDLLMNYYLFRRSSDTVYEDICPYHYKVRKGSAATSAVNLNKLRDPINVWRILSSETKNDKELNAICVAGLADKLIRVSTEYSKSKDGEIKAYAHEAREQLKQIIPIVWSFRGISIRIRLLSLLAIFSPALYRYSHKLYSRLTGRSRKYHVS